MSEQRQANLFTNRPMRRTATCEKRRVFAEEHIASTLIVHFYGPKTSIQTYISLEQLRMNNMQLIFLQF